MGDHQRKLISDLLSRMAAAYPRTFFVDPRQVRPLKIGIYENLCAALPAGVEPRQVKRFLSWYIHRAAYQRALMQGQGRIDLTGAMVDDDIPATIREQAREHWQQLKEAWAARQGASSGKTDPPAKPPPAKTRRPAAASPAPLNLEELYAMAVDAKLEVTLKFTTLPNAQPVGPGKLAFALKTQDGQFVTAEVGNKVWNKLVKAAADWPAWTAALSGTMGAGTGQGFALANPGLQVFERKAKAPEAATPAAAGANPAEPAAVPPALVATDPNPANRKPVLSLKSRKATS